MEILNSPLKKQEPDIINKSSLSFFSDSSQLLASDQQNDGFFTQFILPDFEVDEKRLESKKPVFDDSKSTFKEKAWQIPMDITEVEYKALELARNISSTLSELMDGNNPDEEYQLNKFISFRTQIRTIPAYTKEQDGNGKDVVVANRATNFLTNLYNDYFQSVKNEALIKGYLEKEKEVFDERWKEWFGWYEENEDEGEAVFVKGKQNDFYESIPDTVDVDSCGKIQQLEMEARRAYLLSPNYD